MKPHSLRDKRTKLAVSSLDDNRHYPKLTANLARAKMVLSI